MAVIKQGVSSVSGFFNLDGLDYPKGICYIGYSGELTEPIEDSKVQVGLKLIERQGWLQDPIPISVWKNGEGVKYSTLTQLLSDLHSLGVFKIGGGNGNGSVGVTVEELFEVVKDDQGNITLTKSIYDLQVPPESIEVGEAVKISDTGQTPSYTTKYDGKHYMMIGYEFGDNPTPPLYKEMDPASSFDLQPASDTLRTFTSPIDFYIVSRQAVIGMNYRLKIYSEQDINLKVFRLAEGSGEETMIVDEILPQETLSLDGVDFDLRPKVDFANNKTYRLSFTSSSDSIDIKGIVTSSTAFNGVHSVFSTQFIPYIRRNVGHTYREVDITHLQYTNKRVAPDAFSSSFNRLNVTREDHKKRLIVSDDSKKVEAVLPTLTPEDDGWTCQIVNLMGKMVAVGGYKFKNGGSITLAYLGDEDRFIHLAFEANGSQLDGVEIGIRDVDVQTYDIVEGDDGILINMKYEGDWVVNLPDIEQVADDFRVTMIHKKPGNFIGDVVSYTGDTIDGNPDVKMYGQGLISLRKIALNGSHGWFVFSQVSYNDVQLQGKTRVLEFNNQAVVNLVHNLGFIPMVQVWVEDGSGGYTQASVDIDHNWSSKNEFTVTFSEEVSGKILY